MPAQTHDLIPPRLDRAEQAGRDRRQRLEANHIQAGAEPPPLPPRPPLRPLGLIRHQPQRRDSGLQANGQLIRHRPPGLDEMRDALMRGEDAERDPTPAAQARQGRQRAPHR
jgi:hypothetical protein